MPLTTLVAGARTTPTLPARPARARDGWWGPARSTRRRHRPARRVGRVAHADNSLQQSTPAADSTVNQAPTQIVLTFENPTGTGTIVSLVCGDGDIVTRRPVAVADNVVTRAGARRDPRR